MFQNEVRGVEARRQGWACSGRLWPCSCLSIRGAQPDFSNDMMPFELPEDRNSEPAEHNASYLEELLAEGQHRCYVLTQMGNSICQTALKYHAIGRETHEL